MSDITHRYATFVTERSRLVIVVWLLLSVLVGMGLVVGSIESAGIGEFEVDSPETEAASVVEEQYPGDDRIISQLVVRDREDTVLTQESLLAGLDLQIAVLTDDTLNDTLAEPQFAGFENLVGTAAVRAQAGQEEETTSGTNATQPPLVAQRDALAALNESAFERLLERVLTDGDHQGDLAPAQFLPRSYDQDQPRQAEARLTQLFQHGDDEEPTAAYGAQVAIAAIVEDRFPDAFLFGQGVTDDRSAQAVGDSFLIITPIALAFVLFVLGVAYRDPLDIMLGVLGIAFVMVWLLGSMAWLEIPSSQLFIAIPFLLIGLSIDYAMHLIMRYREARAGTLGIDGESESERDTSESTTDGGFVDPGVRRGMVLGLGSVILALTAATFSTGVGFLSNVVSPLPAIQDFAVLSATGILATFLVFGLFLPALKVELDSAIENRLGRSRRRSAFGVASGRVNRSLSAIARVASRAPVVLILVALILATGGVLGATTIDTEFNEADFIPREAPEWTSYLPGPLEPGSYTIRADFTYLNERFATGERGDTSVLIREGGDGQALTDPALLALLDEAAGVVPANTINRQPDGTAAITGPHTLVREVAAANNTVNEAVQARDETGNGLPDSDIEQVFDLIFAADEAAAEQVISRRDGDITSMRLVVSVRGDAAAQTVAGDVRALATEIEDGTLAISAVATGDSVTTAVIQDVLLETLVQALAVTIVVILVFLTLLFWWRYRALSLGPIVLAPVVISLCWLLGAMAVLDIPFNSETAVITSLAIGLGVDYSIHAGERFLAERQRRCSLTDALEATVTGTGGALLASAGTTAAGFGVLSLSLAPPIQRFGIVTASAIGFAFLACLTVLPCLFVIRERILGT